MHMALNVWFCYVANMGKGTISGQNSPIRQNVANSSKGIATCSHMTVCWTWNFVWDDVFNIKQ